jgi:hypothetical protein
MPNDVSERGGSPLDFALDRYVERIQAFEGPRFEVATLGSVTYRSRPHPILSVRSRAAAPRTLLVLAGVHGDERAGLLAVPAILEAWRAEDVRLVAITPVNPVGAARNARSNGDGRDINRDFVRFDTAEARAVRGAFDRERPDFVVSLHEGPQRGAFMFTNRFVSPTLARALRDDLAEGSTELSARDYFGRKLDPPGLAEASAVTRLVWKLGASIFARQASIVYSQDRRIPEIVLESSSRSVGEAARVRPHVARLGARPSPRRQRAPRVLRRSSGHSRDTAGASWSVREVGRGER